MSSHVAQLGPIPGCSIYPLRAVQSQRARACPWEDRFSFGAVCRFYFEFLVLCFSWARYPFPSRLLPESLRSVWSHSHPPCVSRHSSRLLPLVLPMTASYCAALDARKRMQRPRYNAVHVMCSSAGLRLLQVGISKTCIRAAHRKVTLGYIPPGFRSCVSLTTSGASWRESGKQRRAGEPARTLGKEPHAARPTISKHVLKEDGRSKQARP
ncbi:hypothetical protein VTK73DRAFT_349 [Phialemonium thermophilum]|uniref:Uncharacterized protein n=1 Tax=Phialemonium thermophilum TaxID=223376 RepID=A0ABR3VVP2_9PEZI